MTKREKVRELDRMRYRWRDRVIYTREMDRERESDRA